MGLKFNPLTAQFDLTGSGGGASYIDGEVATYNDLPLDGTAALNSAWLVREASGIWPVSRKQAGIYIRTATAGSSRDADYTYAGTMPDVFSDSVFLLYDEASTTRTAQFNLGSITAGQNRVLTWPDSNGTIARTEDFATPPAIGSTTRNTGAFTTLSANNGTQTSTAFAPALTLAQTWNTIGHVFSAFTIDITQTAAGANSTFLRCVANNNSAFEVRTNGTLVVPANGSFSCSGTHISSGQVSVASTGTFAFTSGTSGFSNQDTFIRRDAASTIAFRDLANPQTFRIYNTTDAGLTNFERGFMRWSSNNFEIGTEAAGTGTVRETRIVVGAATYRFASNSNAIFSGTLNIAATAEYQWFNRSIMSSSASGIILLTNSARDDWSRLQFGGTTSSFPALKRSLTALQVRLADDSAFAPLVASEIGIGVTPERPIHIQGSAAFGRMDRQGANGPAWLMIRMATGTTVSSSWLFGPATGVASVANDDFSIIDYGTSTSGTGGTQRLTIAKSDGQLTVNGNLNLSTKNLVTDTTTGTKIGTATTQKLGFFNATPVDQPNTVADPTGGGTVDAEARTAINDIIDRLQELGLIA